MSNTQEKKDQYKKDTKEILSDDVAYIRRKFNSALKNLDRNLRRNVSGKMSDISPLNKRKDDQISNKGKEA